MILYRQVSPTSWVAYDGRQAIWEATTEGALVRWVRDRGMRPVWDPLRVAVFR